MKKQFLIHSIKATKTGFEIGGVVHDGTIRLSDEFDTVYELLGEYDPVRGYDRVVGEVNHNAIHLIVENITAFRRPLKELEKGMCGVITVTGNVHQEIREGNMLRAKNG